MLLVKRAPRLILPAYVPPVADWLAYIDALAPVAHWRMNEAAGATGLVDRIAGEQATLTGSYTLGAPGLNVADSDKAVLWNGGRAYTAAGSKWALGSGDYSLLILAKWTSASFQTVLAVRDATAANQIATIAFNRTAGSIEVQAQDGGQKYPQTTDKSYADGGVHVIGVSQVASSRTLKLYVDGILKQSVVLANARAIVATMNVNIASNIGGIQAYTGTADEIVMFNSLLADAQMADLANIALLGHT